MMNVLFTDDAWHEYVEWMILDKRVCKAINVLIEDIRRNGPLKGNGQPEVLKHFKGCSRRINHEHRLVYTFDKNGDTLCIVSCEGHYDD